MSDQEVQVEVPENANEGCVGPESAAAGSAEACQGCPNQAECASGEPRAAAAAVKADHEEIRERFANIQHTLLIVSGKGGVGKSSFTAQLAWSLAELGFQVGVLDVDICGPSMPRMFGVEQAEVRRSSYGWSPVYVRENLALMSIGFLLESRDAAVVWRGPRKNGLIRQFLTEVYWGELDFLLIDTPPGTSDEHISLAQFLGPAGQLDGCVVVTTPQEVSLLDVRKEITFCRKVGLPILGVVENMSGFVCPCCDTKSDIFARTTGGAEAMCKETGTELLGAIPLDPQLLRSCEAGESFFAKHGASGTAQAFEAVRDRLLQTTPELRETVISLQQDKQVNGVVPADAPAAAEE